MLKIAILDDYAKVALQSADWSVLRGKAEITVFDRNLSEDEAVSLLQPFDVLCTVRERMSLPRSLFQRLPNLKLVTIIGMSLPNLDMAAATDHGVIVAHSNFANPIYAGIFNATPELTWGLMIAVVRHFALASRRMRAGGWQSTVGTILAGRTLGLLGLGRIGKRMAADGRAFDLPRLSWSHNLTHEAAAARCPPRPPTSPQCESRTPTHWHGQDRVGHDERLTRASEPFADGAIDILVNSAVSNIFGSIRELEESAPGALLTKLRLATRSLCRTCIPS